MTAHIHLLPPEEASKIAAGEVVDRPSALVRELIDNAIDAGSMQIDLNIEEGGKRLVEVIDDGCGMEKEDLEICWQTHATSKIRSISDLNIAQTLGFRGEALAAAAVVSNLEILTSTDGRSAWRLQVGPGGNYPPQIEQSRRIKGTTVRTKNLFDTIPVRKRFLKRDWSEISQCRSVFIDKTLAFPAINFRFLQDGAIKTVLPAVGSLKERFTASLLHRNDLAFLHEISASGEGFTVKILFGGPELSRTDRKHQYIFTNGRRIQDYSFVQALEYGVEGWFPNNTHPVGAIFINIDPSLVDFNIHPAKREVRFSDSGAIHHAVTQTILDFVHHKNIFSGSLTNLQMNFNDDRQGVFSNQIVGQVSITNDFINFNNNENVKSEKNIDDVAFLALEALGGSFSMSPKKEESLGAERIEINNTLRYAGKVFELFILIEKDSRLFIIDQHAAHERILYDGFLSKPIQSQELLVPIIFTTESEDDDRFLKLKGEEFARLGIVIEKDRVSWRIEALPVMWKLGDLATVKEILNLKSSGENIAKKWATTLACHSAIKDGEFLDEKMALSLAESALKLPDPRCPHGRPIWFEISREELFRCVKRST